MRLTVHITVLSYAGNLRDLCFLTAVRSSVAVCVCLVQL